MNGLKFQDDSKPVDWNSRGRKCGKPSFDTLDEWSAYEEKLI
jgi:hypothetical protein